MGNSRRCHSTGRNRSCGSVKICCACGVKFFLAHLSRSAFLSWTGYTACDLHFSMSMIKGAKGAKGAQTRGKLGQTQCDCTAHGTDVRNVMSTPPHSQRLHQLQSVSARLQALTLGCLDRLHARGLAAKHFPDKALIETPLARRPCVRTRPHAPDVSAAPSRRAFGLGLAAVCSAHG